MLGIVVDFEVEPTDAGRFRALIHENARISTSQEPGCLQFDVLTAEDRPECFLLYEIYRDQAAFEAHLRTAHFHKFDRESAPLVRKKVIRRLKLGCSEVHGAGLDQKL